MRVLELIRLCLLMALVLLLPVRGAVAATLWCPMKACDPQQHAAVHAGAVHAGAVHAAGEGAGAHHDHGTPACDSCNTCAAYCGATPLASQPPVVPAPDAVAAVVYPPLSAAPVRFQSGGPDRPPRGR